MRVPCPPDSHARSGVTVPDFGHVFSAAPAGGRRSARKRPAGSFSRAGPAQALAIVQTVGGDHHGLEGKLREVG